MRRKHGVQEEGGEEKGGRRGSGVQEAAKAICVSFASGNSGCEGIKVVAYLFGETRVLVLVFKRRYEQQVAAGAGVKIFTRGFRQ